MRLIGDRAIDSLRLEKGYGIWSAEFTQAYTPAMSGLDASSPTTRPTSSDETPCSLHARRARVNDWCC